MKKFLSLVLAATLLLLIPGCQSGGEAAAPSPAEPPDSTPETPAESAAPMKSAAPAESAAPTESAAPAGSGGAPSSPAPAQGSNVLIAYFSWAENAVLEGDVERGSVMCGQVAGMLHEIRPVRQIFEELYAGAKTVLRDTTEEWA